MIPKSIQMVWIVVADIGKAIRYYTDVMGMTLKAYDEEMGWAEFGGEEDGGAYLGVAQVNPNHPGKPGQNAVVCINVDNVVAARAELELKGARLLGEIQEVPGHVKLQTLMDLDGNVFQIAEVLHQP
jgi:predicted enzyme related to lactoylglutathione lyase